MIWKRDQYLSYMAFEDVGRTLFCELFGTLPQTEAEWRAQGATEEEINLSAFGFDSVEYVWIPAHAGILPQTPRVIEETADFRIATDEYGRKTKLIHRSASIPLPLEYPVKDAGDWERIKPRYEFSLDRVDHKALFALRKRRDEGALILANLPGGFDEPRQLMGEEALCIAFYDEPEMIRDMLGTMADTALRVFEMVCEVCPIDQVHIHEDMAGKTGPLIGPNTVSEFITPYYRRVFSAMKNQGASLFSQDSDGNMLPVIDVFLESGLNCMYPFEPQAGMDLVQAREKYNKRLAIKGGLDKFALRRGKEDIRRELEYKFTHCTVHGGVAFGLDHRIPNGVSIENYRYYVATAREMLGLEPARCEKHVRMAF